MGLKSDLSPDRKLLTISCFELSSMSPLTNNFILLSSVENSSMMTDLFTERSLTPTAFINSTIRS